MHGYIALYLEMIHNLSFVSLYFTFVTLLIGIAFSLCVSLVHLDKGKKERDEEDAEEFEPTITPVAHRMWMRVVQLSRVGLHFFS